MEPLTAADRAELHALAAAATPGPWEWDLDPLVEPGYQTTCYVYQDTPDARWGMLAQDTRHGVDRTVAELDFERQRDAEFIAAARDAVPRLLATLAALETDLAVCRAAQQTTRIPCAGCGIGVRPAAGRYCAACQDALAADNARLRAGLAELRAFHADAWCSAHAGYRCNCGADEQNAAIDALLTEAAP